MNTKTAIKKLLAKASLSNEARSEVITFLKERAPTKNKKGDVEMNVINYSKGLYPLKQAVNNIIQAITPRT